MNVGYGTARFDMQLHNGFGFLMYEGGFDEEDLFPKHGSPTNIYDYSKIKSNDPAVRYEKMKPLTTISSATPLPVLDATKDNKAGYGLPIYTLSVGSSQPPTWTAARVSRALLRTYPQHS
eukprot:INCI12451.1.p2 GENE.INCI12451.1~~INCI12451.1.p2  ORF type:complete len:120 (-),score=12.96 INCI12451.1:467-826(-)